MAWLATGSYQSKPTASMPRCRVDVYTASTTRRGAGRRVTPRRRDQAAPRLGSRTAP